MPRAPLNPQDHLVSLFVTFAGPTASRSIKMALDTGATLTLISFEVAYGLGTDPARSRRRIEIMTASGMIFAPVIRVSHISLLGHTLADVDVLCHDLPAQSPVAGLLGLNVLRRFNVFLAFVRHYLELSR